MNDPAVSKMMSWVVLALCLLMACADAAIMAPALARVLSGSAVAGWVCAVAVVAQGIGAGVLLTISASGRLPRIYAWPLGIGAGLWLAVLAWISATAWSQPADIDLSGASAAGVNVGPLLRSQWITGALAMLGTACAAVPLAQLTGLWSRPSAAGGAS